MAGPVTDAHRIIYKDNVILALQEAKDQFSHTFMFDGDLKGKAVKVTELIGSTEARRNAPEGGPTPDMENSHEPVWVRPERLDWGKLMKVEDMIKALTDYKSSYVQSGVNGMTRAKNTIMASALFGPRLIGGDIPVATAWAGDTVGIQVGSPSGAPADTGLNVAKINRAIRLMQDAEIDIAMEEMYIAADPTEIEQLYSDLTFTSKDYRNVAVFEEKRVLSIMGIPIIATKKLADAAANQSVAALYCKSGMIWGDFMPPDVKSSPNPDKQFREQVYMEQWLGATRTEDKKVVKILTKY